MAKFCFLSAKCIELFEAMRSEIYLALSPEVLVEDFKEDPSVMQKNWGFFASRDIKKGETIFTDFPMARITEDGSYWIAPGYEQQIWDLILFVAPRKEFANREKKKQKQDFDLLIKKINLNGYGVDYAGWHTDLYFFVAFINHSCAPNTDFDPSDFTRDYPKRSIVAQREILKNEELTLCYVGQELVGHASKYRLLERQNLLKKGWGFDCSCIKCKSDYELTLQEIASLKNHLQVTRYHQCDVR